MSARAGCSCAHCRHRCRPSLPLYASAARNVLVPARQIHSLVPYSFSLSFESLGVNAPILKALAEEGYTAPTPIQAAAIPPLLSGRDLLGLAQTGTGKTAAFAIPILQRLAAGGGEKPDEQSADAPGPKPARGAASRPDIHALILTPTRELAIQIDESFAAYGRHMKLKHTVIFGGVSQHAQVQTLQRGVDILVATPGRLLDLIDQKFIHLHHLKIFVLDEADRMLDMGFIHDVRKVIAKLPAHRQNLFFSATMPPEAQKLADAILKNPEQVAVTPVSSTAETVDQEIYFVDKGNKPLLLRDLLRAQRIKNALVFTRTKHGADRVARDLSKAGIPAEAIHGNKSQNARVRALDSFKNGGVRVLVATDIAARGIDIEALSHVVQYELPEVPETYVHRIGRTGRAGATGAAIAFCEADEIEYLQAIEKLIRRSIPEVTGHPYLMVEKGTGVSPAAAAQQRRQAMGPRPGRGRPASGNSEPKSTSGRPRGRR